MTSTIPHQPTFRSESYRSSELNKMYNVKVGAEREKSFNLLSERGNMSILNRAPTSTCNLSINLMERRKAMMGTFVKKIFKSVPGFSKCLTESLLKSRDFISKIGDLRRRKEAVHELGHKIVPSCDRIGRFFFKPCPGYSLKRKRK
ncbi:hypothetical protein Tco_0808120 [Tanacetum coccineum]